MALHGALDGEDYAPIRRQDIANSGLDYLALGHVHQCSGLQREGGTHWAYCGCPHGRGFDELGEKGVLCVEVTADAVTAEFVPLGARRYEILCVDLTDSTNLLASILTALPAHTEDDIYRIRLVGQRQEDSLPLADLRERLSPRFYTLDLRDETRAPQALWARQQEDNLTGLFLTEMRAEGDDATHTLAVRFGLAALERREDVAL